MKRTFLIIPLLLLFTSCTVDQSKSNESPQKEDEEVEQQKEVEVIKSNPVITIQNDSFKTVWNKPIDLFDGVSAIDYLGNSLKVSIVGKYSFEGTGKYDLQYTATDSNGAFSTKSFTLIVEEPPIACPPDSEKGTAADNPYLPCNYVFEEELKNFENNTVITFEGNTDSWELCALEEEKYDKTIYNTDCMPLLDNVRNVAKVGLWVEKINQ